MNLNGTLSLENAVFLRSIRMATAYFREWAQIEAVSEPLDWTAPGMAN